MHVLIVIIIVCCVIILITPLFLSRGRNDRREPKPQRRQAMQCRLHCRAIQRYVEGRINESVERRTFRRRVHQPGETFDDFLISLRELAKTCNFCSADCTQKHLRDQIIEGLLDGDTTEHLQEKDLTLDKTIDMCRAQEAVKKKRAEIAKSPRELPEVCPIRRQLTSSNPVRPCPGCASAPHKGGHQRCPAYNATCFRCKRVGHYARVGHGGRQLLTGSPSPSPNPTPSDPPPPGA